MKDFFKRIWMPAAGAGTSLSFKGIEETIANPKIMDVITTNHEPLITYFWIGVLGALGGLIIKIAWGCLKKIFPKLKNIDK